MHTIGGHNIDITGGHIVQISAHQGCILIRLPDGWWLMGGGCWPNKKNRQVQQQLRNQLSLPINYISIKCMPRTHSADSFNRSAYSSCGVDLNTFVFVVVVGLMCCFNWHWFGYNIYVLCSFFLVLLWDRGWFDFGLINTVFLFVRALRFMLLDYGL